ncbi:flagellar basal body rod protein FlgC [Myxococcota bacterium]|nr:flagellar basal body rod protein FlgC [Myxococcota bacterium]MBU1379832.1 flagellar basal body rod protein FlgC [Myxococcota bacterium]MBU1496500.1 flagellar basal body rod protein FlgC [Myxococcota bacterium]
MNTFTAMEITSSGLAAQRVRLNTISGNLANAQTTRTAEGGPYKRRDPVFQSAEVKPEDFEGLIDDEGSERERELAQNMQGVLVTDIVKDKAPPRMEYNPDHPDADARGYVAMPNVNTVEEMVNMISASRSYEAGVTMMQTIKGMGRKAITIGR